jgi:hypothetical protein
MMGGSVMTEKQSIDASSSIRSEFSDIGQKAVNSMMDMQKGFLESLAEMNQYWVSRTKSEAELASTFLANLTAARSIPDTSTACQEFASRQLEIFMEDGRRLLAASQKMMPHGSRNGSAGGSR